MVDGELQYVEEDSVKVGSGELIKYNIRKGNIRIIYDSTVCNYTIDDDGIWVFNPYRKNRYALRTIYYNSYSSNSSSNSTNKTFNEELFSINADYVLESYPSTISAKKGSTVKKTVLERIQ